MEKQVRITLKPVGAITRSTVSDEDVDPRLKALDDVLHWCWSWETHIARMRESMLNEGKGQTSLEKRRTFSRVSFDEHLLCVVGLNLPTAIKIAHGYFPEIKISKENHEALRLLRNIYEHWEGTRKQYEDPNAIKERSPKEFEEKFPHGKPWAMELQESEIVLGGVVKVNALTSEVHAIEEMALKLEKHLKDELNKQLQNPAENG